METIRQTEPPIGSDEWWAGVDAHIDAYWGYPDVQQSILDEANAANDAYEATIAQIEESYRRVTASEPVGALSMMGVMA